MATSGFFARETKMALGQILRPRELQIIVYFLVLNNIKHPIFWAPNFDLHYGYFVIPIFFSMVKGITMITVPISGTASFFASEKIEIFDT